MYGVCEVNMVCVWYIWVESVGYEVGMVFTWCVGWLYVCCVWCVRGMCVRWVWYVCSVCEVHELSVWCV